MKNIFSNSILYFSTTHLSKHNYKKIKINKRLGIKLLKQSHPKNIIIKNFSKYNCNIVNFRPPKIQEIQGAGIMFGLSQTLCLSSDNGAPSSATLTHQHL